MKSTKEHNEMLTSIKNGTHKQFYFDKKTEKVMCKCGDHAVWFREAYLCSSITVVSRCKY
jgi:hypothetical protein